MIRTMPPRSSRAARCRLRLALPPFLGDNVLDARPGAFPGEVMQPVAIYRTALVSDVEKGQQVARLAKLDRAEAEHGVTLRAIGRAQVAAELPMLYQLASRISPCDWSFAPTGSRRSRRHGAPDGSASGRAGRASCHSL